MTLLQLLFAFPGTNEFLILFAALIAIIFWVKMLIEIATYNYLNKETKITWLLITIFLGIFGALLYYGFGRDQRLQKIN
jgi:Phospholipase_D-nuclease N-terminal